MDKAWPDTFVQPEVLASHIRDISAALGDNARKPRFIETLARRGYRFIAKLGGSNTPVAQPSVYLGGRRLVGRDSFFSKLEQCYRTVSAGQRRLVFVTGEPGIGPRYAANSYVELEPRFEVGCTYGWRYA